MDNLLKTLLKMDDNFELINVEMDSDISWRVEVDELETRRVPSPRGFSPASPFESFYPPLLSKGTSSPPGNNHFLQSFPQACTNEENCTPARRSQGLSKKMSGKRRMKASEREKLRMRRLAGALHTLRSFLPPVYSQRGQTLTKIQTLHCAIRYISELSTILAQGRYNDSA
ncbi:mesogenin-1 [Chiloscyllium punctatum]|uniref:Mesogenin-1 n=1 Tax=Chiloscyllium punctatum TaxID=137246 RepID=A0A401SCV8_CHIPU|nr:hypothetical protein [Chiloscyllium punctatum]